MCKVASNKGKITTSDFLPFEEYQRLVNLLTEEGKYRDALYCILGFSLTLRISDVLMLKWGDILDKATLVIKEKKTRKIKEVAIGPNTQQHILDMYKKLGEPSVKSYVFESKKQPNTHISPQYINREMKHWKDKYHLQIGNFSSHSFRKTFGRYVYNKMNKSEEGLIVLMKLFNHTSISTTMTYIGLRHSEMREIMDDIII